MTTIDYDRAQRELNAALRAIKYETVERARVEACHHVRIALLLLTGSTPASIVGDAEDPDHAV